MQNLVVQKGSNDLHICNVYLIQMYTFDLYICIPNFDKHVFGPNTVFGQLFPSPESPAIASAPPKKKLHAQRERLLIQTRCGRIRKVRSGAPLTSMHSQVSTGFTTAFAFMPLLAYPGQRASERISKHKLIF